MHKYSLTTDLIYPTSHLSLYKDLPDDLVDISKNDADIHMGNIQPPEGKRRKRHQYPFVWEDIPEPNIEKIRTEKLDEIYRLCGEKINAGIQTDVVHGYMVHYRLNGHDQLGIDSASRRASGGKIWRNEVYEQHSQADAIAVQELKDNHVESCKLTYYNKRTYILSESRTSEEIQAVTWDSVE